MSEPVTIKLQHPIEFGKETISELTLRRGRMGDLKGINVEAVAFSDIILVAWRLSGQPTGVIERLDEDDAGAVTEYATDFFRKCLSTGRTGSPP